MKQGDYLGRVLALLGGNSCAHENPQAWEDLEAALGVRLPGDFKTIVDGYAPVLLHRHLYLLHPATSRWNLGEYIQSTAQAFRDIPWGEIDLEGDPRESLGISKMEFGTPVGLLPILPTDRGGETIFMATGVGDEWRMYVNVDTEFFEYPMSFSEWLYNFLQGEEVSGSAGAANYPGPVKLQSLPMYPGDETLVWFGPERS